jgi:putative endopeptidase
MQNKVDIRYIEYYLFLIICSMAQSSRQISASDNFYLHVNKNWLDDSRNRIPDEYSTWGGFVKLHDQGLKNQIDLIQNLIPRTDEEKKITALWKASCRRFNEWENGISNYEPLINELNTLNGYFSSTHSHIPLSVRMAECLYYTQTNGISNVFDFDRGSDLVNANNSVLEFLTSGLSLPGREHYMDEKFADKRQMYREHLNRVYQLVNTNCYTETFLSDSFVEDVLSFEHDIAYYKMKQEQARRYDQYYTNTTLTDLWTNINELNFLLEKDLNYPESNRGFKLTLDQIEMVRLFLERTYELFDFRNILKNNCEKNFDHDTNAPHPEHVTGYDGDAIRRAFALILDPLQSNRYRSYLQYKIISSLKGFCSKELDEEFFDFYGRKLLGQVAQKSSDKRSIQIVNDYAGEMMGKVYVSKYFPEVYKKNIRSMIDEIIQTMHKALQENDWLTETTKQKAREKLNKFNVKVGYPDVWKDYSDLSITDSDSLYMILKNVRKWKLKNEFFAKLNSTTDRDEWMMTPQTVNAYFMPTLNEIVFPAAIMQPPFYYKSVSELDFDTRDERRAMDSDSKTCLIDFVQAANFGGIGAVIAHEITHGYDDKGRLFDGDGNLNDWWTPEDVVLFKAKTDLMALQAETYSYIDPGTEDNKTSTQEYRLNPQLTMGENLADLGGLSLALKAMTSRLRLRGLHETDIKINQRILFKSFANIWKQNIKKDYLINQLTTDCHAPTDFRTNLVKNMDEFYDVFNVLPGDPMYIHPSKRVRMW